MSYMNEFFQDLLNNFKPKLDLSNIGEDITHAIIPRNLANVDIFGFNLIISDATVAAWFVMVIFAVIAFYLGHKPQRIPEKKRQQFAETLVDILLNTCRSSNMTYDQAERIIPYVGTIAVFISMTNLAVLLKIPPPAKNPAFPIALAIITIVYVIVMSIKFVGWKGFWASLTYPSSALLPFKILDFFIKPISLSLRLFGNVFGAFILMEFVYIVAPMILPGLIGLWFDIADGILQGIIFTYLSITYIGEVIESAHASAHDKAEHQASLKTAVH
jgi:F-type H+-transporting ATPase subunit a